VRACVHVMRGYMTLDWGTDKPWFTVELIWSESLNINFIDNTHA